MVAAPLLTVGAVKSTDTLIGVVVTIVAPAVSSALTSWIPAVAVHGNVASTSVWTSVPGLLHVAPAGLLSTSS